MGYSRAGNIIIYISDISEDFDGFLFGEYD
jgi:hypothetical protein